MDAWFAGTYSRIGRMTAQSVILFVSNRCNLECRFCFETEDRIDKVPSLDEIRDRLARFDPAAVRNVMFMGAETLLRKDAPGVLQMVHGMGFRGIGVATNGTMIDTPERLQRLMDAGLEYLELSVHSLVPEHAAFLGGRRFTPARQRRCLEVVDSVKSQRALECTINTVVMHENVADVVGIMTGIERDYPNIRPHYYVKNAIPTPQTLKGGELASLADMRSANLVDRIPGQVRTRVHFSGFPLCVLRPHYELSGELVGLVGGDSYAFLDERHDADGIPETSSDHEVTLAEDCAACGLRSICCGVEPHQAGDVVPIAESDVQVVNGVLQRLRARGVRALASGDSDPERLLEPLRRRADAALERARAPRPPSVDIEAFKRLLLAGAPPVDLGAGARITALRAPPGRARVELDFVDQSGLELVVHVEPRTPGGLCYLATRDLALSHGPTAAEVSVARLDQAMRTLAGYLAAREGLAPSEQVKKLFGPC